VSPEEQLAETVRVEGRRVLATLIRTVGDMQLAEDAVQEAFLAIWRGAARFVPERGKASTWILTVVHRRAVDLVRREQRRRAEPLEQVAAAARGAESHADLEAGLRSRPAG